MNTQGARATEPVLERLLEQAYADGVALTGSPGL